MTQPEEFPLWPNPPPDKSPALNRLGFLISLLLIRQTVFQNSHGLRVYFSNWPHGYRSVLHLNDDRSGVSGAMYHGNRICQRDTAVAVRTLPVA
jgi:hypothetical protein